MNSSTVEWIDRICKEDLESENLRPDDAVVVVVVVIIIGRKESSLRSRCENYRQEMMLLCQMILVSLSLSFSFCLSLCQNVSFVLLSFLVHAVLLSEFHLQISRFVLTFFVLFRFVSNHRASSSNVTWYNIGRSHT